MTASASAALRRVAAIGGGLIGIAALAGCAPSASGTTTGGAASTSAPSASSTDLNDGSYSAVGHYQSPAGDSMVGVTVTLRSGTITAVKVTPETADPTAQQYESQFASGISGVAVGKPIAGLQVGAVSGSSLTSQGFEAALAAIEKKAAA